jgi:hypothetical protein
MASCDLKSADRIAAAPDGEFDRIADAAVAAIISAGAEALTREPWRVERIVSGARALCVDELAAWTARRARAGPPADFNLAIAFAKLALALKSSRFCAAWTEWRHQATTIQSSTPLGALRIDASGLC